MRRLRFLLLGVAIALAVPVALLAWRALDGLEMERALRYQAVAERAFDEMERVLTGFLDREERRPFEDYTARLPDGRSSPLARHELPFVVGAFQIAPDGALSIPAEAALGRHDTSVVIVRRLVSESFERGEARMAGLAASEAGGLQPPGTTLAGAGRLRDKLEDARASELEQDEDTAYDVIQSLNRAADERLKRRQEAAVAKQKGYRADADFAPSAPQAPSASLEPFAAAPERMAKEAASRVVETLEEETGASPLRAPGAAPARDRAASARVREALPAEPAAPETLVIEGLMEPMLGRAAGAEHLVLYRTVLRERQGYRQGLVIELAALGTWLAQQVVESSALASYATLAFARAEAVPPSGRDTFVHRFAEPFDGFAARMHLTGLPGASGPGVVHALVGLLALLGAAGVLAIHRMVSVVVHFAERRNNFVAAVTHELKTPLTAIRMYGEMLRDGMVADERKRAEYYGTITDESERLSRLIDNVLEFSRLEHGTRDMSWVVGAPGPVILDVAERLRAHAGRQGFVIETAVAQDLPAIRYDRDALLQVLFNLVDNAMKYANAADERRVVLEARRSEGGGVALAVRDFGPGVDGHHLPRIFEPFYRGEDELTRTTKGTGIGLSLVKELAERMGAAVVGRNAPGGGFRVEIAFTAAT